MHTEMSAMIFDLIVYPYGPTTPTLPLRSNENSSEVDQADLLKYHARYSCIHLQHDVTCNLVFGRTSLANLILNALE